MRPLEEWADLKYREGDTTSHVVAFGDQRTQCKAVVTYEWRGTGDFDEFETALALPRCQDCTTATRSSTDPAVSMWHEATFTHPIQTEDLQ